MESTYWYSTTVFQLNRDPTIVDAIKENLYMMFPVSGGNCQGADAVGKHFEWVEKQGCQSNGKRKEAHPAVIIAQLNTFKGVCC